MYASWTVASIIKCASTLAPLTPNLDSTCPAFEGREEKSNQQLGYFAVFVFAVLSAEQNFSMRFAQVMVLDQQDQRSLLLHLTRGELLCIFIHQRVKSLMKLVVVFESVRLWQ